MELFLGRDSQGPHSLLGHCRGRGCRRRGGCLGPLTQALDHVLPGLVPHPHVTLPGPYQPPSQLVTAYSDL